jgi:hypothetical protein
MADALSTHRYAHRLIGVYDKVLASTAVAEPLPSYS